MYALFRKEISSFLSSLIGITVVVVFLLITGLFLWVFKSDFNILSYGYASLDSLFVLAPWVFLFLVPSVTMRSFAEERRTGTIEMILTKPLSDWQIIGAKYLAGIALVLLTLIPTLIYYISVSNLAMPAGNIDHGGIWGSYIGLFFLSAAFVSIGIFCSSVTGNRSISSELPLSLGRIPIYRLRPDILPRPVRKGGPLYPTARNGSALFLNEQGRHRYPRPYLFH